MSFHDRAEHLRAKKHREFLHAIRWLGPKATREELLAFLGWTPLVFAKTLTQVKKAGLVTSSIVYHAPTPRERVQAAVASVTLYHTEGR